MHLAKSQRSGPRPIIVKVDSPAGKIPANDLPSERAILSSAMLSGPCLDIALELLREEHFYDEANGKIFRAMSALAEAGKAVDINSVRAWLSDAEWLQRIGGTKYLLQISDETPSVHEKHMRGYCEVVIDKWRIRRLADTTGAINAQCYGDYGGDASAFIDASEQALYELAREQRRSTNAEPLGPILAAAVKTINDAAERGARITGIPTGYEKLDAKTAGLHDGELTIVAARPGMGKTSLVLNIGVNVASPRCAPGAETYPEDHPKKWARGHGVAIFSLEMPREQLAARMLCSEARVDLGRVRNGLLQPDDWRRMTEAAAFLSSLPIWIDDTPAIGLLDLRAKVRRIQAEYNRPASDTAPERRVGLVVVDYLQLMKGRDGAPREQEISEISRGLKGLAKELKVPVVALSQLNRAVEIRSTKDKRPQLSDLRESGAIEQDSDNIVFIYRDDYYNPDTSSAKGIAELIISKQRNGPTGKVLVRFAASCTRFDNLASVEYPDMKDECE